MIQTGGRVIGRRFLFVVGHRLAGDCLTGASLAPFAGWPAQAHRARTAQPAFAVSNFTQSIARQTGCVGPADNPNSRSVDLAVCEVLKGRNPGTEERVYVMLRRVRGIVGMALVWGAAFAMVGAGYAVWRWSTVHVTKVVIGGRDVTPSTWVVALRGAIIVAPWGMLAGVCFALALIVIGQRRSTWRRTDALPTPGNAAAFGAVASIALPLATVAATALGILSGAGGIHGLPIRLLGAVAAAGSGLAAGLVALARMPARARLGEPGARSLPRSGDASA
ncbi:MAG: hypothetical protein ACJ79K_17440 [Gemmatimonadaceae bacterium]